MEDLRLYGCLRSVRGPRAVGDSAWWFTGSGSRSKGAQFGSPSPQVVEPAAPAAAAASGSGGGGNSGRGDKRGQSADR